MQEYEVIHMVDKQNKLKTKSDSELHEWITRQKQRTDEYIAGIQEIMDRNETFVRKRELIATGIAILSLVLVTVLITSVS